MAAVSEQVARRYLGQGSAAMLTLARQWDDVIGPNWHGKMKFLRITLPYHSPPVGATPPAHQAMAGEQPNQARLHQQPPEKKKTKSHRGGTLVVAVAPSAVHLVAFDEQYILERANRYFGYRALTQLAVKQGGHQ